MTKRAQGKAERGGVPIVKKPGEVRDSKNKKKTWEQIGRA